jgi:NAD(P)-dependent dehydrogenase (short-subunit alcohol dehydrogenase family)
MSTIGVLGTGRAGHSFARALARAGHSVIVSSRGSEKEVAALHSPLRGAVSEADNVVNATSGVAIRERPSSFSDRLAEGITRLVQTLDIMPFTVTPTPRSSLILLDPHLLRHHELQPYAISSAC